jgi:repressor LexA
LNYFQKKLTKWLFRVIVWLVIKMTIYQRIKFLREEKGMTQQELAEKVGFKTASAVNKIELGLRDINQTKILAFATALGTTPGELMGGVRQKESVKGVKIPVLGYVRAGIPIEAVEEILDYEEISQEMASQGEHFALSIKGDSMEPKISEGDVVIVRKQNIVENGELAVVLVNGNDATVKKFYMNENGVALISTNPTYDPFYYSKEDAEKLPVQVIGKVVELRAKF